LIFLIVKIKKMKKNNDYIIPILGFILTGISGWICISIIELQVSLAHIQEELLNLNKDMSRIYSYIDTLINR